MSTFVVKMASQSKNDQHIVIKFYIILGNSFSKVHEDLHAVYGDSCGTLVCPMVLFQSGLIALRMVEKQPKMDDKYTDRQKR